MSLLIRRGGFLTTVQDAGRWGYQGQGVPVAGPMDPYSSRVANLLVGNEPTAALLEITLVGPDVEFERDVLFAVAGAEFAFTLDGEPIAVNAAHTARAGSLLEMGTRSKGARAYFAVAGGIAVAPILGSRATHVISAMGGLDGRALRAGDRLEIEPTGARNGRPHRVRATGPALPVGGATLRVILGPQDDYFTGAAVRTLTSARYIINPESDRMGYRLSGPRLEHARGADIISDATPLGTVQVPASGEPILLMADRQTTGGYPKIATLISADVPLAGQLGPGDWIDFSACDQREAVAALLAQERALMG